VISDSDKKIHFLSAMFEGSIHDFTLFKTSFGQGSFKAVSLHVDLGFLGIENYSQEAKINIPHKKPKNKKLSQAQKEDNRTLSSFRVSVENTIAMIKRYFILRIENRMHINKKLDSAVEICSLLWNFKKKCKSLIINT